MGTFLPQRSLLNPKFEGYKLDPIAQEDFVSSFNLPFQATQSTSSNRAILSFQEIQSRITHNHFAISPHGPRAVYIDVDHNVISIELKPESLTPEFRVLFELPKAIRSPDAVESLNREYPSAVFLGSSTLLVADGNGTLYVFRSPEGEASELVSTYRLPASQAEDHPFRIHSIHAISATEAVAILSSRNYESPPDTAETAPTSKKKHVAALFDIWAVKFAIPFTSSEGTQTVDVLWRRQGENVPIHTAYDELRGSYILLGGGVYRNVDAAAPPSYEPTPDELAPIPRPDENIDAMAVDIEKPPPYSWTQTSESVTIAFPLPSTTSKADIQVKFSMRELNLQITGHNLGSSGAPIPNYASKELWDGISPSSSYWTWDREGSHTFGLLTLYLDKQHEGTKWAQVFAAAGASASAEAGPDDVEVPETLDPSELWHIRESLEKYTAALRTGEDASGLGLGRGVPSLAEGEIDEEVDASVGRSAYVTWVGADGSNPSWPSQTRDLSFQLLSTALPGSEPSSDHSIIIKNDLDGAVYSLLPTTDLESPPSWKHVSSYSALAFVLASKTDTRFTYHIPSKAVLAFENGLRDRGGNVYIYRASNVKEKWAKQAILKVGDGDGGSLLGVGEVTTQDNRKIILCLMERELVLIKGI